MAAVTELCFLLVLIRQASVMEPIYLFPVQGQKTAVRSMCTGEDSYALFYRSSPYRDQLINKASNLSAPAEFVIPNVTQADSGDYYVECRNQRRITKIERYILVVCADEVSSIKGINLPYEQSVDCELKDFNLTQGDTLHIYSVRAVSEYGDDHYSVSLLLNLSRPLETVNNGQRFGLQVLANNTFRISAKKKAFFGNFFYHTWSGNNCRMRQTTSVSLGVKTLFLKYGQNITLQCSGPASGQETIVWHTPGGYILSSLKNHTPPPHDFALSGHEMYIDGHQSGNSSLVIPFVSANISGYYYCLDMNLMYPTAHPLEMIAIFVCIDLDPINMTFSRGSRLVIVCDLADVNHTSWSIEVQWYRKRVVGKEELILEQRSYLGKVNTTRPQAYLAMSDLSPEDSGIYRCKVWGHFATQARGTVETQYFCSERRFNLEYKDTFAIDSVFYHIYASMMGWGLLVMVCAVVYVTVKKDPKPLKNVISTSGDTLQNEAKRWKRKKSKGR